MLDATAELIEKRLRPRELGRLGAREPQELALPRRAGRAADGTLDEVRAGFADLGGKLHRGGGPYRAHVDDELAREVGREDALWPVIDGRNGRSIGQDRQDHVRGLGDLPRRAGKCGTGFDQRFRLGRRPVPHHNGVSCFEQPRHDRGRHPPRARNSYAHADHSCRFERRWDIRGGNPCWPGERPGERASSELDDQLELAVAVRASIALWCRRLRFAWCRARPLWTRFGSRQHFLDPLPETAVRRCRFGRSGRRARRGRLGDRFGHEERKGAKGCQHDEDGASHESPGSCVDLRMLCRIGTRTPSNFAEAHENRRSDSCLLS